MSLDPKDYEAVVLRSSTSAIVWHLGFVQVQSYHVKSVCVKLQERCSIHKLTSIEDDDSMLLSNKLHSFGLTTRTIEAEFVAPRGEKLSQ